MTFNDILEEIQQQIYETFDSQDPELLDTIFEIDGKKLYADKLRLSVISSTFKSMLSDRWNSNKNDAIKIKEYKFEDFKELLTFIYSGKCNIIDENISTMIDMAEFYQIKHLKKICEKFLSKIKIDLENVIQLIEISSRYSLKHMKKLLQSFVYQNFDNFLECDKFLNANESAIEDCLDYITKQEEAFEVLYQWTEHQAVKKHESIDEILNVSDTIKANMSSYLSLFQFENMKKNFVRNYVVSKRFLFSQDKYNDILEYANYTVKLINPVGQTISGKLPYGSIFVKIIKTLRHCRPYYDDKDVILWNVNFEIPLTPSPLKKKKGIEWYLVCYHSNVLGVIRHNQIIQGHQILAEMNSESNKFCASGSIIHIE